MFYSCTKDKEQKKDLKKVSYSVAILPTPVLNTPDFESIFGGNKGRTLKLINGQINEIAFIALPNTVFTIEETHMENNHEILKVTTKDYPYKNSTGYFIDSRFVEKKINKPRERIKTLLDKEIIIKYLLSLKGAKYVWGGNFSNGISEMLTFYKPDVNLTPDIKDKWTLKGVDCSGLLYEATNGFTPRNTESLFDFGSSVKIQGLSAEEIAKKLKPLDIIVYKRHVIIVLNSRETIESTPLEGVHTKNILATLKNLMRDKIPADKYMPEINAGQFVVRRWHPE
jgi:hypothetical protein